MSLSINFFMMFRRLVLLYVAMFLESYAWLQIIVFTSFSLSSNFYLAYTMPYKERLTNRISLFNELDTLLISYLVMVLVGLCDTVK